MTLITIGNDMTSLTIDLASRSINSRTKNTRTRAWLSIIMSLARLEIIVTSTMALKLRATVVKITTSVMTIETTLMAVKTSMEARGKLRRWS